MSNGRRPGGLTALAVCFFIFAAFGLLNVISTAVMMVMVRSGMLDEFGEAAAEAPAEPGDGADAPVPFEEEADPEVPSRETAPDDQSEQMRLMRAMFEDRGPLALILQLLLSLAAAAAQLLSGVGLMSQKRIMGRHLGNAYAILAVAAAALVFFTLPPGLVSEWSFLSGLILPVLSLVVLNTTFKDDLVF